MGKWRNKRERGEREERGGKRREEKIKRKKIILIEYFYVTCALLNTLPSLNSIKPVKESSIIVLIYRWRNQGLDRLSKFLKRK